MSYKLNKYKNLYGLGAIFTGVFMLVISFLFGWTNYKSVLIPEIVLVIGGVIVHYMILKKRCKYQ